MLNETVQPLANEDLARLDHFLHSTTCGGEAMGVSFAHGFLTAVSSGPERVEPAVWLPLMFDQPVFDDGGDEAREMLGLALRMHEDIERGLRGETAFHPVFEYVRSGNGHSHADASAWSTGFVAGFRHLGERWPDDAREALRAPLGLIFSMAETPGAGDPLYAQICDALPGAAELMFRYWRARGSH